jgi:hypothetical protein
MSSTSAAAPAELQRYADAEQQRAGGLRHEAMLLAAALDRFAATCTEFPTGIDGSAARPLADHANRAQSLGAWVGQVGSAFRLADQGTSLASPRIEIPASPRITLARSVQEIAPALSRTEGAINTAITLVQNAIPSYQEPAGPFDWLPELSTIGWIPGLGWYLYKNRLIISGIYGGVRFVQQADGIYRVFGSRAAKLAMGLPGNMTTIGAKAIERYMKQWSVLEALKRATSAIGTSSFSRAARDVVRTATTSGSILPLQGLTKALRGAALIGLAVDVGKNVYDYGWGAEKDKGFGREFAVATVADASAGLVISGASVLAGAAAGAAIGSVVPGIGTAVGFVVGGVVGIGLGVAYDQGLREHWHNAVDGAAQWVQDQNSSLAEGASSFARDASRAAGDFTQSVGESIGGAFAGATGWLGGLTYGR